MELTKKILAGLMAVTAVVLSPFWTNTQGVFSVDASYEQLRSTIGFGGIPMSELSGKIDAILPRSQSLSLDPSLAKQDFLKQRLTEGLYPRTVDLTSPYVLSFAKSASVDPNISLRLISNDEKAIVLNGPDVAKLQASLNAPSLESFSPSLQFFFGSLLASLGIGLPLYFLLRRKVAFPEIALPFALIVSGAFTLGAISTFSTWLQLRLPWLFLNVLGIAILCGVVVSKAFRKKIRLPKPPRSPETWVLGLLLAVFFFRVLSYPITLWDGRSIWLFHAKKLFFEGMISKTVLLADENLWSWPDKPLLLPTWLAHFTSLSPLYNERLAALGLPILLSSLLALIWLLARKSLGRWPGAALTITAFLSIETLASGAYADPFVMLSLLLMFLSFSNEGFHDLGWVAGSLASLMKLEGFVCAVMIGSAFLLFEADSKNSARKKFASLLFLSLAPLHALWSKLLGFKGMFGGMNAADKFADFFGRWSIILGSLPDLLWRNPILPIGFAGVLATVALLPFSKEPRKHALLSFGLASAFFAFSCCTLFLTPYDLRWHIGTALDRLLLHPAILYALTPFLLLRGKTT